MSYYVHGLILLVSLFLPAAVGAPNGGIATIISVTANCNTSAKLHKVSLPEPLVLSIFQTAKLISTVQPRGELHSKAVNGCKYGTTLTLVTINTL